MKIQARWAAVSAVIVSLAACGKKEEPREPELPTPVPQAESAAVAEPVAAPEPVLPSLGAAERAAMLGFIQHLPAESEAVMSIYNGAKSVERVKALKAWTLLSSQVGGVFGGEDVVGEQIGEDLEMELELEEGDLEPEAGIELDEGPVDDEQGDEEPEGDETLLEGLEEEPAEDEEMGPGVLFGREITVALGRTGGQQVAHLLKLNDRSNYFRTRSLTKSLVSAAQSGESDALDEAVSDTDFEALFLELLNDPESGMALLDQMAMPPLYFAFRTSESERAVAAQQVSGALQMLGMMGDMIVPLEVERAGQQFEGYKIAGENIAKMMDSTRASMEESIDPETLDKLLVMIAKKDIVVLTGTVGEYVILFIGGAEEDFQLAESLEDSMAASDALAFADAYASKDLVGMIYGQKESMELIGKSAGGLAEIAKGVRDGLAGSEGLGDTRDIEAMLQLVTEREALLRQLATTGATGIAAFVEEGLKIESFGGTDQGAVDWETPLKLSQLGNSEDVVLFANMSSRPEYDQAARAYLDALFQSVYAITLKVSELPLENEEIAEFKKMAALFDENFRADLVALWEAFSGDLAAGLGEESAFVMDLQGGFPPVPGVPQPVVDDAKIPRISMVAPVSDRARLQAAWEKMNESGTRIMAQISEISGHAIPMQKPLSSEKDGLTTWAFQMPFFTEDFMPSVTVSDEWFAASSSRRQAVDLIAKAAQGGEGKTGLWVSANFRNMQQFAAGTLTVMENHAAAIFGGNEAALEQFEENKKQIREAIAAMDDFDRLTLHSRRENGILRSSFHVKTR